jgi:hypothetical protein
MKTSETSGINILLIGIALLFVTFTIAGIHIHGEINVLPVPSLMATFGEALSHLLEAAIRMLYLIVLGCIATKVTTKGVKVILQARLTETTS